MAVRRLSHVVGFDDAPFARTHRGDVLLVGAVFSATRLDGIVSAHVRRDGRNATATIATLVSESRFRPQLHAILLQGIAFAGFNVVDIHELHAATGLPVIVACRKRPDFRRIRAALLDHVKGGTRKWRLIEKAGPMEAIDGIYVQRAGIELRDTALLLRRVTQHSRIPEPLRVAHLVAGGIAEGESRHPV